MLLKTILVFLAGMALLGMIGNAVLRASGRKSKTLGVAKLRRCPQCGRTNVAGALLGRKNCGCGGE